MAIINNTFCTKFSTVNAMLTNPSPKRPPLAPEQREIEELIQTLDAMRTEMLQFAAQFMETAGPFHPVYEASARNLLHYLALRQHDLRPLQARLAVLGLSSLGRAEAHVLATIEAVLKALLHLAQLDWQPLVGEQPTLDFAGGARLLEAHTKALLGAPPPHRNVRIMVTMPSEAADDYDLVYQLLQQGMNCMRINCAHDEPATWLRMIQHLRRAEQSLGMACHVLMDLGGPKLRTGPIEPGPMVLKWRPQRNEYGRVTKPARIWLTRQETPMLPPTPAAGVLPVPSAWLVRLAIDDHIELSDTRHFKRLLHVVDVTPEGCWAEARRTAYVVPGTLLHHHAANRALSNSDAVAAVGDLPARENALLLKQGDHLRLTKALTPGRAATLDSAGQVLSPARIGCTSPEIFADVRVGEHVWLDDGKLGSVIEQATADYLDLRITHTRAAGDKLRSDKGINFPESALTLPALTDKDIEDLTFVAQYADLVGLSFANQAADIALLHEHLTRLGGKQPAIVIKVETRRGFEQLPAMLLTALKTGGVGVMIARGDLAVECGYERLAEVQEEILWVCEAAHCPVIWATQVLETLAKEGIPSRAEITDAAMGHRAECVMLNKGPHIVKTVHTLDDILQRMEAHQSKKQSMLRELRLAQTFATHS